MEEFESSRCPVEPPSPVDAILFRLDQLGLSRRDLTPYLGSSSKVSEVLSGKRPLSLKMIRGLHRGLGISAEVLLQEPGASLPVEEEWDWSKFPVREMVKRGYVQQIRRNLKDHAEDLVREFLSPFGGSFPQAALLRRGSRVHSVRKNNRYALAIWASRVLQLADQQQDTPPYLADGFTAAAMRGLTSLTRSPDGPAQIGKALAGFGIRFVVEAHFPGTRLDGALLRGSTDHPVVALSLRHDRIDNFWFTLFHELAHLVLHSQDSESFFDDLDLRNGDRIEAEADQLAAETLVPAQDLEQSGLLDQPGSAGVGALAAGLGVHPAVVAGRVRHETGNFRILNRLLGSGEVRRQF